MRCVFLLAFVYAAASGIDRFILPSAPGFFVQAAYDIKNQSAALLYAVATDVKPKIYK